MRTSSFQNIFKILNWRMSQKSEGFPQKKIAPPFIGEASLNREIITPVVGKASLIVPRTK